jgi:hypothetical protein
MIRRRLAWLAALGLVAVAGGAIAQQGNTRSGYEAYVEAMAAYRAGDMATYRDRLARADSLVPGQPALRRRLAGAEARLGRLDAAGAWLTRFASMNVRFDLDQDRDLDPLRDRPEYAAARVRQAELDKPLRSSMLGAEIPEKQLITEGIAFDPGPRRLFISSVHKRKILSYTGGRWGTFAPAAGESLWAPLGMAADPDNRSLWVATTAMAEMAGWDSTMDGKAELVRLDLVGGRTLVRYAVPDTGLDHNLNDVVLDGRGRLYVSDSRSGAIYRVEGAEHDRMAVFLPRGTFGSPNGLAVGRNDSLLYVSDYTLGVYVVDVATLAIERLAAPDSLCLNGVDGLVGFDGGLVMIQNGIVPHRLVRVLLDPSGRRITSVVTLDRAHPLWDEPTLGVMDGQELFYLGRSQWGKVLPGGAMPPADSLALPTLMRVRVR